MYEFAPLIAAAATEPLPASPVLFATQDDLKLINSLVALLSPAVPHNWTLLGPPALIAVDRNSRLGQWMVLFGKAINQSVFLAWADAQHLEYRSIKVMGSSLHANVIHEDQMTPRAFHLHDDPGWLEVSVPILGISEIIDPNQLGVPYIDLPNGHSTFELPLELTLAFYGYTLPKNQIQARMVVDELQAYHAFPTMGDNGRAQSATRHEMHAQHLDLLQLADHLEQCMASAAATDEPHDSYLAYRQRLTLRSDSFVAHTLKEAAQLLQSVINSIEFTQTFPTALGPDEYFIYSGEDHSLRASSAQIQGTSISLRTHLGGAPVAGRLIRLAQYASLLGEQVASNNSLSLAQLMHFYAIEVPLQASEVHALIARLRQSSVPGQPYCSEAAQDAQWLKRKQNSLSALNNFNRLQTELERVSAGKQPDEKVELDDTVELDTDSMFYQLLEESAEKLLMMIKHRSFVAICVKRGIDDEKALVLLTEEGYVGADDRDGRRRNLTDDIVSSPALKRYLTPLQELAKQLGGELRSDMKATLKQLMKFLRMPEVKTAEQARQAAHYLRAVRAATPRLGNYWQGLGHPQPSLLTLSSTQRRQVYEAQQAFAQAHGAPLFKWLGEPCWAGRSAPRIRAEADMLLNQMVQSPRSQLLVERLNTLVIWSDAALHGTTPQQRRQTLLLSALILSLDEQAGTQRNLVGGLAIDTDYYWGDNCALVRSNLEALLRQTLLEGAPLAAHLLLSGSAPQLLVRNIPETLPYLCNQNWVVFKQFVDFIELKTPGASRYMTLENIMTLVHNPATTLNREFWALPPTVDPVLDWARANGVVDTTDTDLPFKGELAVRTYEKQKRTLNDAFGSLHTPYPDQKEAALRYLREVYPDNAHLDKTVFMPAPFLPPGIRYPQVSTQDISFSLAELYLAGELKHMERWRAIQPQVRVNRFSPPLRTLKDHNADENFHAALESIRESYIVYIAYLLSCLPLPRRVSLEQGNIALYLLRKPSPSARDTMITAHFGCLLRVRYQRDRYLLQLLPRQMLITQLANPPSGLLNDPVAPGPVQLQIDWSAYLTGSEPVAGARSQVLLHPLDATLITDTQGDPAPIPKSWQSARLEAIARMVVDQCLLSNHRDLSESTQNLNNVEKVLLINKRRNERLHNLKPY
jgi:hypothetical protein